MRRLHRIALPTLAAALLLAGCGGGDGGGEAAGSDADAGREVFVNVAEPTCGTCHTLADANASGKVGPNLDELQPSSDRVAQAVRTGLGVMPSYAEKLSDEQIEAVAAYVADAAG